MPEMVKTTICGTTFEEPDTDLWDRLAMEAITSRYSSEPTVELAGALQIAVDRIRMFEAVNEEMAEPQREQLDLAELRVQLDVMTRREKRWRESALEKGSQIARASVQSFSEFCDGHKAGMRKALEVR